MKMALIYETENFVLESHENPEIDRLEGGHVKISPKNKFKDRTELPPRLAIELMHFSIICGEAMKRGMKKSGVNIGRVNYQENGNWKPELHLHLYCRSEDATLQKFGEPIVPGHQKSFMPLTEQDMDNIKSEIKKLFSEERFSRHEWNLD